MRHFKLEEDGVLKRRQRIIISHPRGDERILASMRMNARHMGDLTGKVGVSLEQRRQWAAASRADGKGLWVAGGGSNPRVTSVILWRSPASVPLLPHPHDGIMVGFPLRINGLAQVTH